MGGGGCMGGVGLGEVGGEMRYKTIHFLGISMFVGIGYKYRF